MFYKAVLFGLAALLLPLPAIAQTDADFFDGNTLHEIRLEINPGDWALLKKNFLDDTYYACVFHWIFNGKDIATPEVAVRSRGEGSRSGTKPSLKIEFDRYESKQNLLGLKSLVLRANTQDASMMHERVAMEFLRKMGLPAAQETHTTLYVNGEYAGLYTIVEDVDKRFVRDNFGEDAGYLYSYQYQDPYFFEDRGSDPATYSPVPFQPEFSNQTPNPAPIAAMIQTINHAPDGQFQSAVSQYVDLKEFLTEIAGENFLAEQDGLIGGYGMNNFYLYRFAGKTPHTFIPWDKSNTFFLMDWPIMHNISKNVLSRRAMAVPELQAFYLNELARAAEIAGGPGGWLEQEINREYQQIREAAYADTLKLCDPGATGDLRPCSNEEFDAEVANMLAFAQRRAKDVTIQLGTTQVNFSTTDLGGFTSTAAGSATPFKAGYARIQTDGQSTPPSGFAILSLRNEEGAVVSEATVPESPLIQSGRIYAEVDGPVNTGLAIANPNDQPATLSFYFTDAYGSDFGHGTATISPKGQLAQFLSDPPFNAAAPASGTFTFSSSVPVAAIGLQGLINERSEFLMTTLPVASTAPQTGDLVFPHFADGGGWTSKIILVNPSDQLLTGVLQFFSQGRSNSAGEPVAIVMSDGATASSFSYSIPAHSSFRLQTAGNSANLTVGSARVVPAANTGTPTGVNIFAFRSEGVTVTQAGVEAIRASSAFRLYAEWSGDFASLEAGSIQTGIAVANSSANPAAVNFELRNLDGTASGITGAVTVPANGQSALFLNQVPGFSALPPSFRGVLRISGPSGISVMGVRGRYNERGDFLITTIPALAEDEPATATEMIFPHIVEGAGYTTQFVLFSGQPGQSGSGMLQFLGQDGQPLTLVIVE